MSRLAVRTYSKPVSDSAHSALARSSPTRSTMVSGSAPNPGSTKPVLRPDAFQATRRASSTTTDQPRRTISRAAVRPGKPCADDTDIDVEIDVSLPRGRGTTMVASYQLPP